MSKDTHKGQKDFNPNISGAARARISSMDVVSTDYRPLQGQDFEPLDMEVEEWRNPT